MTTATFIADSSNHFVNWHDPARWSTGVVPNDPAIDVVIPLTTVVATGQPYQSYITVAESYAVGSLAIDEQNYLYLNGTLTVTHNVSVNGGHFSVTGGA